MALVALSWLSCQAGSLSRPLPPKAEAPCRPLPLDVPQRAGPLLRISLWVSATPCGTCAGSGRASGWDAALSESRFQRICRHARNAGSVSGSSQDSTAVPLREDCGGSACGAFCVAPCFRRCFCAEVLIDPPTCFAQVNHDTRIFRFALPSASMRLGLPTGLHMTLKAGIDQRDSSCPRHSHDEAKVDGKPAMRAYTPMTDDSTLGHVDLLVMLVSKDGV